MRKFTNHGRWRWRTAGGIMRRSSATLAARCNEPERCPVRLRPLLLPFLALAGLVALPPRACGQEELPPLPEREQRALAALEELGASASRDRNLPGHPVTQLALEGSIKDEDLKWVAVLSSLEFLHVHTPGVTDAGLAHLAAL